MALQTMACVLIWSMLFGVSHACSIVMVGKAASASGNAMVSHSTDAGGSSIDVRVTRTPRKKWNPDVDRRSLHSWAPGYPRMVDSKISPAYAPMDGQTPFVPLASIPQVAETWAYWDTIYSLQNEWGLSMGESTSTARTVGFPATPDKPYGFNHIGIADLSKIGMERCKTARCAIQVMGDLAVEHGFYSEDSGTSDKPAYADSGEALGIADATGEVWVFDIMTGKNNASAIWAAQRVPDDHVAGVGNSFTIRHMRLDDPDNFMYSKGIADLAIEKGWWDPTGKDPNTFDFFGTYGSHVPLTNVHQREVDAYYSGRRHWRMFNLLTPEEGKKLDPARGNLPDTKDPYPMSLPAPKGSVTLDMVFTVHRDHYEGTDYDLTKGMAAGPFGNPNRGGKLPASVKDGGLWERAISMHRTAWSYVCVPRADGLSIMWYGQDAPHGTAYLPIYAADGLGPPSFHSTDGYMSKFSNKVAWWAFNVVNQYQDLNFQLINADVRAKASAIEAEGAKLVVKWEAESSNITEIAKLSNEFVEAKVAQWWEFRDQLYMKFGRYKITHDESEKGQGSQEYPEWWVASPDVGYKLFTPQGPNVGAQCADPADKPTPKPSDPGDDAKSDTAGRVLFLVIGLVVGVVFAVGMALILGFRRRGRTVVGQSVHGMSMQEQLNAQ